MGMEIKLHTPSGYMARFAVCPNEANELGHSEHYTSDPTE